jgi:hypothetical protein
MLSVRNQLQAPGVRAGAAGRAISKPSLAFEFVAGIGPGGSFSCCRRGLIDCVESLQCRNFVQILNSGEVHPTGIDANFPAIINEPEAANERIAFDPPGRAVPIMDTNRI